MLMLGCLFDQIVCDKIRIGNLLHMNFLPSGETFSTPFDITISFILQNIF
jgi:hypothetical protein